MEAAGPVVVEAASPVVVVAAGRVVEAASPVVVVAAGPVVVEAASPVVVVAAGPVVVEAASPVVVVAASPVVVVAAGRVVEAAAPGRVVVVTAGRLVVELPARVVVERRVAAVVAGGVVVLGVVVDVARSLLTLLAVGVFRTLRVVVTALTVVLGSFFVVVTVVRAAVVLGCAGLVVGRFVRVVPVALLVRPIRVERVLPAVVAGARGLLLDRTILGATGVARVVAVGVLDVALRGLGLFGELVAELDGVPAVVVADRL